MTTIVYLVNQLRKSGPIHVLKNIITNLDRNAFRPVIIKFMRDDKVRSITNEFAEMGVEIHEMNLTFWDLELRTSYVARKLDVLLEKIRPDFLHTHGYHPVIVASLLKCICPKIETLHCISTDYYISSKGYLVGNWMNRRYNKGLSAMDCCVAISNSVCDFYKEIYLNLPTFINEDYFTLFVTENGVSETLVENGWTLSMEKSKSVRCQSDIKCYKIFKDNLCLDLSFINAHLTIPLVLRDCLETFNKAQRCTTQYDLDNLKKDYEYNKEFNLWKQLYEKNEEIKELNKRILNAETDLHHKEQTIEDYKDLLIQIKDLIEQK